MELTQNYFMEQIGQLEPIFEIEAIDLRSGDKDYLICDIFVYNNKLVAQRVAFNELEANSDKIASTQIDIDNDFDLDHHLQELYSACIQDIIDSDFYDLPTED